MLPGPHEADHANQPGAVDKQGGEDDGKISVWRTLMNVGLGIMSGTSPQAGVNIGAGALKGLQMTDKEQQTRDQTLLRRDAQATNAAYRNTMAEAATTRAEAYQTAAEARAAQALANANNIPIAEARKMIATQAQAGNYDSLAANRVRSGDQRDTALTIQQGNQDLRRQALQQASTVAERRLIETASDAELRAATQLQTQGAAATPAIALQKVREMRQGTPTTTPQAPARQPTTAPAIGAAPTTGTRQLPAASYPVGVPAQPKSQADFDALPPGAHYVNPADGKVYKKNAPAP
jgi:hypothetical protein